MIKIGVVQSLFGVRHVFFFFYGILSRPFECQNKILVGLTLLRIAQWWFMTSSF